MPRPISLLCRIFPGGFSGERVVRVTRKDGSEHVSMAPRHYCWKLDKQPLGPDEPAPGESIEGLVAARLMVVQGGAATVSLPDGALIVVNADLVKPRPSEEIEPHVSV
jgi:hypothetical protein